MLELTALNLDNAQSGNLVVPPGKKAPGHCVGGVVSIGSPCVKKGRVGGGLTLLDNDNSPLLPEICLP